MSFGGYGVKGLTDGILTVEQRLHVNKQRQMTDAARKKKIDEYQTRQIIENVQYQQQMRNMK